VPLVEPALKLSIEGLALVQSDQDSSPKGTSVEPSQASAKEALNKVNNGVPGRADKDYEPSQQWLIWAIMFGVLILAVVLTL